MTPALFRLYACVAAGLAVVLAVGSGLRRLAARQKTVTADLIRRDRTGCRYAPVPCP